MKINFLLNFSFFFHIDSTMSDNKLVKTVTDAAVLTGLVAGIGWIARKVVKENSLLTPAAMP